MAKDQWPKFTCRVCKQTSLLKETFKVQGDVCSIRCPREVCPAHKELLPYKRSEVTWPADKA